MLRDGVVTPVIPRIAADDSFYAQPNSGQRTMFGDCLSGIVRTTRRETTARGEKGTQQDLIATDDANQQLSHLSPLATVDPAPRASLRYPRPEARAATELSCSLGNLPEQPV